MKIGFVRGVKPGDYIFPILFPDLFRYGLWKSKKHVLLVRLSKQKYPTSLEHLNTANGQNSERFYSTDH